MTSGVVCLYIYCKISCLQCLHDNNMKCTAEFITQCIFTTHKLMCKKCYIENIYIPIPITYT